MSSCSGKNVPILMYHSIAEQVSQKFQSFGVSPALFAEQMAYLHDYQYTPITVTHYTRACMEDLFILPDRPVVITFDDGFADFFTHALPILQLHNFVATLYVTTAFIGSTSRWLRREGETTRLMLTWDQLRAVSQSGIECGAHSHSHPQLDILPLSLAQEEVVLSKKILEYQLEREIHSFAYPFGYQTAKIRTLVQQAGYISACAVKHRMSQMRQNDPFALPRLKVNADMHSDVFAALLTDRNLSPAMALQKMYLRTRTPLWQLVRRTSVSFASSLRRREVLG